MLETCFTSDDAQKVRGVFKGFVAKVLEGRWGTIAEATVAMEAVESSLREFWSLRKYNFDMGRGWSTRARGRRG